MSEVVTDQPEGREGDRSSSSTPDGAGGAQGCGPDIACRTVPSQEHTPRGTPRGTVPEGVAPEGFPDPSSQREQWPGPTGAAFFTAQQPSAVASGPSVQQS